MSGTLKDTAKDTIRQARWAKGFTVEALAEKAGVSASWLTQVENGHRSVNGLKVYRLADALELEASNLLEQEASA